MRWWIWILGNATMGSNVDKRQLAHSVYDVLLGGSQCAQARIDGGYMRIPRAGANRRLAGAEVELVNRERREIRLNPALASIGSRLRLHSD